MKNLRKSNNDLKQCTKDIQLPNEEIKKILAEIYCQKSMHEADNLDVDINHLENIFTNETCSIA